MALQTRGGTTTKRQEISPEMAFTVSLIDAGGNLWSSPDLSKKRVYFNSVRIGDMFMNGFFDCVERKWHVEHGNISGEEFGAAIAEKIAAGVKF
jgi:hypothetical protein